MMKRIVLFLGVASLVLQFGCATGKGAAKEDPWPEYPPPGAWQGVGQYANGYWWMPAKIGPEAGTFEGVGNRGVIFYAGAETPQPVLDSDGDGVPDNLDKCPGTPKGVKVDKVGCALDSDGDGVADYLDKCPDTPRGVKVDKVGCPLDSDGDGVADYLDKCPDTPKGVKVDKVGCPLDSDGDGVADYMDQCPNTLKGATVNSVGCWVVKGLTFDYNKSDIKPEFFGALDQNVKVMKENPTVKVELHGHTDSIGSDAYNQALSERRANAVREYLVSHGIDSGRVTSKGMGEKDPIASNETPEGRAKNRRVEFTIISR